MEQVTYNKFSGAMSYANAKAVAAGQTVKLSSFRAPEGVDIKGVSFGALFSNAAAWAGCSFILKINNAQALKIEDEIGDLLRPAFLPISVHAKDLIELELTNGTAAAVDVGTMLVVVL